MSKELTEQWSDGRLEYGLYYVRIGCRNDVTIAHTIEEDLNVKEVLAPVPDYSEYQALKDNLEFTHTVLKGAHQKITQLEKELEIATRALKKYESSAGYGREAFLALKEMEGVK